MIFPKSGLSSPAKIPSKVVLPLPEGPVSETQDPVGIEKEIFLRTVRLENFLVRLATSITCAILILAGANSNAATDLPKRIKILAYGDSLTAGFRLPPQEAYPKQLEALLQKEGYPVEIINGGVSGDTSAQALARLEWNLKKGGPFNFVLLEIGANDGLRMLSVAALEKNTEQMITRFKKDGAQVILLGMKLPLNTDAVYRHRFEKMYAELAKKHHLSLIPFFLEGIATRVDLNLDDGIHPTAKGYAIAAQNVAIHLKPMLKKIQPAIN